MRKLIQRKTIDMTTHPLIEKKLRNELTDNELEEFNRLLKKDRSFAEAYKIESDIHQYINQTMNNQETKAYLKKLHVELEAKGALEENKSLPSIKKYFPYAAAALMAGALFFLYFLSGTTNSPQELFAMNYIKPAFTETQRSTTSFQQLKTAYENKDYSTVTQLLENDNEAKPKLKLYLGISHLELEQPDKAIAVFKSLQSSSTIKDQATWYLALCHLKQKEVFKTKTELQKLVDGKIVATPKMKEKAKQLLMQL